MKTKRCHILVCLILAVCLVPATVAGQWHALSHLAEHQALSSPASGSTEGFPDDTEGDHRLCDLCLAWKSAQLAECPVSCLPLTFQQPLPFIAFSPSFHHIAATRQNARGPPVSRSAQPVI